MNQNNQAKIYLLIGFFGSGKTTFIRHLLTVETGQKYAIIQNQFAEGEMGIQQPLIMDETGTPFSSFLQLPNGCICCSAKNDLMAAIQYIVDNTKVKNIVVETNGMADPAQSIKQFWFDQQMNIKAELHSIISIISAKKWNQINKNPILQKQVVYANKVLLSFIDIVGEEVYQNIVDELKHINEDCIFDRTDLYDIKNIMQGNTIFDKNTLRELHNQKTQHNHHKIKSCFLSGFCIKNYWENSLVKQLEYFENQRGNLPQQSSICILVTGCLGSF